MPGSRRSLLDSAIGIALFYVIVAALWCLITHLLLAAHPLEVGNRYFLGNQFFIFATGTLLYFALRSSIGARWAAERALREERRFLSAILDSSVVLIVVLDGAGRIVRFNRAAERVTGLRFEEIRGYNFWELFFAPEEREQARSLLESRQAGSTEQPYEQVWSGDSGRYVLEWSGTVLGGNDRAESHIVLTGVDTTRRQQEKEEKQSALDALEERLNELALLHRAARLLQSEGQSPAEILQAIVQLLPAGWRYPKVTAARISFDGISCSTPNYRSTPWQQSARFTSAEGVEGLIEVVYLEERPPAVEGPFLAEERALLDSLAEMLRGHFAREQVRKALHEREHHFRSLFHGALDAIVILDERGRFMEGNRAATILFGLPLEELPGRSLAGMLWEEKERSEAETWQAFLKRGTGINECRIRRADGSIHEIEYSWSAHFLPGRYLGIFRDSTERRQREREMEAIVTIAAALRSASSREEIVPIILDQLLALLDARGTLLAIRDERTGETILELGRGAWTEATGTRLSPGEGVSGQVIESGQPYLNNNVREDPSIARPDLHGLLDAALCVPLVSHGQVLGALWVGACHPFDPMDVRLVTALGDIAANAIHRTTLHEQTRRRAEQLATVNALGQALSATLDLEQLYERLRDAVCQLLPRSHVARISLCDTDQQSLQIVHLTGEEGALPGDEARRQEVIQAGSPHIFNLVAHEGGTARSALYVPMRARGKVIGLIEVEQPLPGAYSETEAELLSLVANTAAIAIENARLFAETRRRLEQVQALRTIDLAISSGFELETMLKVILGQIMSQLNVDAASVLLLDQEQQRLERVAMQGFRTNGTQGRLEGRREELNEGLAGRAARERRLIQVADLGGEPAHELSPAVARLVEQEQVVGYVAMPLVTKGQVRAVLELYHRRRLDPAGEWYDFLEALARQTAIAVDNAELFRHLQRSHADLMRAYDATIEGWSRALDLRDKETEGHSIRVTEMTLRLARAMGIGEEELRYIRWGALLHDIGKMGIPDHILRKPGPLTESEWEIMRRHPTYGYTLLAPIDFLHPALDIPYCHHEKWDGSGYPRGMKAEEIPLAARIFAVVDVWDALRSDRPYGPGWSEEVALRYIAGQAGSHFDPRVVEAFLQLVEADDQVKQDKS